MLQQFSSVTDDDHRTDLQPAPRQWGRDPFYGRAARRRRSNSNRGRLQGEERRPATETGAAGSVQEPRWLVREITSARTDGAYP